MNDNSFEGWSLKSWSLQSQLLELNFYWGKAIFSRPTRITFSNFSSPSKVEKVMISTRKDDLMTYRISLEKGAFVEIEASAHTSIRW